MKNLIYIFLFIGLGLNAQGDYLLASRQQTSGTTYTTVLRVNLGGSALTATDGDINWQAGTSTSGTGWSISGGASSTFTSGVTWSRHASIPASIPDPDYETLFDSARQSSGTQTFTFTLPNGNYRVNIFTGEAASMFQTALVFDLTIQGSLILDDATLVSLFGGFRVAGNLDYPAVVSDGTLTVVLARSAGTTNFYINAVQILAED